MAYKLVSLLFPPRCPVCGALRIPWESSTCTECAGKLRFVTGSVCMRCGKELADDRVEYCRDCTDNEFPFIRNYAVWHYDRQMKRSITGFKYGGRKEYAGFYVHHMAGRYGERLLRQGVTALVPVPVSKERKRSRGFNQAELLARGLGDKLQLPVIKLLKRTKNTKPQSGLSKSERSHNLSGAFAWNAHEAAGWETLPHVVALIDDIYTTGATLAACTKVLRENGILAVYGVCVCIGNSR